MISQTYKELLRLNSKVDEDLFISRMRNFTKVWEYLYPIEIRKIVKALIKEVMVFEDKIEIKINIDGLNCAIKEYCK